MTAAREGAEGRAPKQAARRLLVGFLALLGLALYAWPALRAPVVHWSDSELDIAQATRGTGIWSPVPDEGLIRHPTKPGYLLFLRAALRLGADRGVAVSQSLLLWASFGLSAWLLARCVGPAWGLAFFAFLLAFLRFRDTGSVVMSEALSAALALPFAVLLLRPPEKKAAFVLLGVGEACLFAVRPNVGAILVALSALALIPGRRAVFATLLAGFLLIAVPWSVATHSPRDSGRAFGYPLAIGGTDYAWAVSGGPLRTASEGWRATLAESGPDLRRQLIWRGFHGLMGTDFYDSRWSAGYRAIDEAARMAAPFWILLAAAVLLVAPWRAGAPAKALGLALLVLLVVQSLVVGALPRHSLPLLPALFAFAFAAAAAIRRTPRRGLAVAAAFVLLVALTAWQRQVVDREAGILEASGLRLTQAIPRGALALPGPATLHIRIATPVLPSAVRWTVSGPSGEPLLDSDGASPAEPFLTIPIPEALREASRRGGLELRVATSGPYDAVHYLWFPVIPPPWGSGARREGSRALSPVTGIEAGSLDWWAHAGTP